MKPCSNYREQIATMAINALEIQPEPELRAHLDACLECRNYLKQISGVARSLRAAAPRSVVQPSASFHRNVVVAVANTKRHSAMEAISVQIRSLLNWRLIIPAGTTACLVIAAWLVLAPRTRVPSPIHLATRAVSIAEPTALLEPTFLNYEMAANQSLDKLDELLTKEGSRTQGSPPIDAVTPFSRLNPAD